MLDNHVPIDREYPSLRQIHRSPDLFVVDDFLTEAECDDMVEAASGGFHGHRDGVIGGVGEHRALQSHELLGVAELVAQRRKPLLVPRVA